MDEQVALREWEKRAIEKLRARVADICSRPESEPHTIWNAQNFLEQVEAAMEAQNGI